MNPAFLIIASYLHVRRPGTTGKDVPGCENIRLNETINVLPKGISFDETSRYKFQRREAFSESLNNLLKNIYLKKFPEVYSFLSGNINLCSFEVSSSVVVRTKDVDNVEALPENTLELFLNLRSVNNLRRVNYYFVEVNKRLKYGGIFAGKIETISLRYKKFLLGYPRFLARLFYSIDFIWRRVFPKLPGFQKIYFVLTGGCNRAISFAEGLGRLYYCGFEIINVKNIGNYVYFIAKK